MALRIVYFCKACGERKPKAHDGMICACGGDYRPDGALFNRAPSRFEPHYCPTLKKYLTSWTHQEREAKNFRSPKHPEGFVMANDNHKLLKEFKNTHKNREDVISKAYADDGIKYPKGKNVNWSDEHKTFIDRESKEIVGRKVHSIKSKSLRVSDKVRKVAAMAGAIMLLTTLAHSENLHDIDGLRWFDIKVDGITYSVPEHKHEFFGDQVIIWMKAIDGDVYSRKYLLGNKAEVVLFIGDGESIRWLHLTIDKVWVTNG